MGGMYQHTESVIYKYEQYIKNVYTLYQPTERVCCLEHTCLLLSIAHR